nr:peptidase [Burkholderia ubonensis]
MGSMNAKPLHIFRAGTQTDMSGCVSNFTEADLAATVRAYDPKLHEAPIVIGHPRDNAPAWGWVASLSTSAGDLQAEPVQVDPAFAELVGAGRFKKISSSFYHPDSPHNPVPGVYYLRHVGFLGAQPPALKGLRDVSFSDGNEGVVEFSDWGQEMNAGLWRRLREWMLTQFGQDTADQVVPDWQIESIREAARQDDPPASAFAERDAATNPTTTQQEKDTVTPEQKTALEAENAQLKQQLADAQARERNAASERRHGDHMAYAEQLVAGGTLAPKHKDAVVAFLDFADGDKPLEFGEGSAKQPLATAFRSFLGDLPKVVDFGEHATRDRAGVTPAGADTVQYGENVDPQRVELDRRIRAYMGEHKVDYTAAANAVIR